jgi:DNA-binding XRE family transcriptional regulator
MPHCGIKCQVFHRLPKNGREFVDSKEFSQFRTRLNKTQKQMGQLLGTSIKAIHSYEQGWRSVPTHVERQVFFLASRKRGGQKGLKSCWITKKCPKERKTQCPAWEFRAGTLCWFINGTICEGEVQKDWKQKIKLCRKCEMLGSLL